ncbi:type VI secretion system contractile sheath large subunit [Belnapia sp. T6]|uniref:Type VI secretion system contractile sheath large subunit n=1 Tax=Belnapia mucosa TaxID=2804532 RepID=A0ABS1V5N3_9PROT|nr:type VI secretion system contractile sheath large subunit [Belnapia mucosa]MBL6456912.1 type VI secretion system contractile sheath large subunit [Belnapia mucosa]
MDGSPATAPADPGTTTPPALRQAVLAGQFLGRSAAASIDAVASFLVEGPATALRMWFGAAELAALLAHDGTARGRAEAIQRLEEAVDRDLATTDRMVSEQLDAVLRQDRLRRLEGSWRGLHWLTGRLPAGRSCKVKLLNLRWAELCRDFERAIEFDQSQLFKKVYEEEFGTPGGEPYGLLCGDWELRPFPGPGSNTDDVAGLDALAGVAAAAFAPTVVAAHPALLGLDSWHELGPAIDPTEPIRGPDRRRWRGLQEREDTRFLAVLLPRVLARPPWPDDGTRPDRFRYRPDPGQAGARAWMNAIYPMAAVAMRAFASYGWPADIRGAMVSPVASGGVVDGLPLERFASDPPGPPARPPVEVALTDDQERQVVEAGLLPLIGLEGLPEAVFAAAPSFHRPPRMTGDAANANQRLSAQFNAVLCVSRFAHCVKMMGRDMVGSFKTPQDIERRLQGWLMQFTSATSGAIGESGARQPLRSSKVEVREKPGQPGVYGCTILMQPHFQLDEVGAAFRLVTDLSAPRAAA